MTTQTFPSSRPGISAALRRRRRGAFPGVRGAHGGPVVDEHQGAVMGGPEARVALMNLGTVEAWALKHSDGVHHLQEGADLARRIGRPYLEVACLAQLGFASKLPDFTHARRRSEQAIALAEEHGWRTATILAPALVTLAYVMVWSGEFDSAEQVLRRADVALQADSGPGTGMLLHLVKGMLHAGRGREPEAAQEFTEAHAQQSRLSHPHALTGYVTGWLSATRARLGSPGEARAVLDALRAPLSDAGEIRNAWAVIHLAEGDPAAALAAVATVIDGTAPCVHVATVVEANVLAALAYREVDEPLRAQQAVEHALALAEPQRLVLPFVTSSSGDLLEGVPRRRSAHAALLTDVIDVVHGSARVTSALPLSAAEALSPAELRVLRYLPTNLSRPEIAGELSVSVNTVNTHVRNIYAKLHATDRSSAVQRARELQLLGGGPSR
ncbi:LuxR C-terminal-related transcriptional regulator [Streptomyces sp. CB01881]|uniref:LuxR C-terminal-related transcriptional regulator n=1 Tax=Streptomyces sp. CB01881 TaxID=2078691 RepID=UPI0019D67559|nr:LuxR C-terminal-related transcriptional regulator [Streptomyces sp. CB01881]